MKLSKFKIGFLISLVILFSYQYLNKATANAFILGGAHFVSEEAAMEVLNTTRTYEINISNSGKYQVKLIDVSIEDYNGIKVGLPFIALDKNKTEVMDYTVPSHRVYNGPGSWSTTQSIMIGFKVEFIKPNIRNPRKLIISYRSLGIKHKQVIELPFQ